VFEEAGYSLLGPAALNCAAPDEGDMALLERVASEQQKERYLRPVAAGELRCSLAMTEPQRGLRHTGAFPTGEAPAATRTPAAARPTARSSTPEP
jgi:acyl-CoA dehydrogenase